VGYRDARRLEYVSTPRVPIYSRAWDLGPKEYGIAAYSKSALTLATLKGILGTETFERVMKTYYQRYSFKHPRTEDFIAVAQEVSGRDLSWFFDQAVYGRGVLDYAVESIDTRRASSMYRSQVVLVRKGEVKFPVDVLIAFGDGSTQRLEWDGQTISHTLTFETSAPLAFAALDPDKKLALEVNTTDNSLTIRSQVAPLLRFASRWLFWMQAILDCGF